MVNQSAFSQNPNRRLALRQVSDPKFAFERLKRTEATTRFKGLVRPVRKEIAMNRKLYVGNLNFSTTEQDLREAFGQVAPVASVSMIMDRETGRPRGFAFVEMETGEGGVAFQA